jgi:hypothetical protein
VLTRKLKDLDLGSKKNFFLMVLGLKLRVLCLLAHSASPRPRNFNELGIGQGGKKKKIQVLGRELEAFVSIFTSSFK